MSNRRTVELHDDIWRAVRMRAVADGKTASEVVKAAIQTVVISGGPILYGDSPDIYRLRYAHEWAGATEDGKVAVQKFLAELEAEDHAAASAANRAAE